MHKALFSERGAQHEGWASFITLVIGSSAGPVHISNLWERRVGEWLSFGTWLMVSWPPCDQVHTGECEHDQWMSCGDQILELFQSLLPHVQCISSELCIKQFQSSCHRAWSDADLVYWQPFISWQDGSSVTCHVTRCGHPVTRPGHVPRVSSQVSTIHKPHQMARHTLRHSPFNPHLATSKFFDIKLVDDVIIVESALPLSRCLV